MQPGDYVRVTGADAAERFLGRVTIVRAVHGDWVSFDPLEGPPAHGPADWWTASVAHFSPATEEDYLVQRLLS